MQLDACSGGFAYFLVHTPRTLLRLWNQLITKRS